MSSYNQAYLAKSSLILSSNRESFQSKIENRKSKIMTLSMSAESRTGEPAVAVNRPVYVTGDRNAVAILRHIRLSKIQSKFSRKSAEKQQKNSRKSHHRAVDLLDNVKVQLVIPVLCPCFPPPTKFIMIIVFTTKFLALNTEFLVFNAQYLDFNTKLLVFNT